MPRFACSVLVILAYVLEGVAAQGQTVALSPLEQLGKELFFDDLSHPDGMACATCHAPETGFSSPDSAINAQGAVIPSLTQPARFGNRKTPSAAYATLSPPLHYDAAAERFVGGNFSDGRATGAVLGHPAADQALGPFLNPVEMNNPSAASVLAQIAAEPYAVLWDQAWGEPLRLDSPESVKTNYDRVGLAIAAYEASSEVNQFTSKYDYYLQGKAELTPQELLGLDVFNHGGRCAVCHPSEPGPNGEPPLFTDFAYHNLGVPKNPANPFYAMDEVLLDDGTPVNPSGDAWIDEGLGGFLATQPAWAHLAAENLGKHKTPTLRNIALAPNDDFIKAFMHNGVFKTLDEVVDFYNTRDKKPWPAPEVAANMNVADLGNLGLTRDQREALVAFLRTLSDGYALAAVPEPGAGGLWLLVGVSRLRRRRR